jgi:Holliday junction DNA helicase RuvA
MVLELKDKVGALGATATVPTAPTNGSGTPRRDEVVEALLGLGFTARPAEGAVDEALAADADADSAALLRAALTRLGRSR